MRALVQRVSEAAVTHGRRDRAASGRACWCCSGVARGDTAEQADRLAAKVLKLRVFEDRSVADTGGEVLCVSQFTLYGDTRKGNRPSYTEAAPADEAEPLYERVCDALGAQRGVFGAHMAGVAGQRRPGDPDDRGLNRLYSPQDFQTLRPPAAPEGGLRSPPFFIPMNVQTQIEQTALRGRARGRGARLRAGRRASGCG